MLKLTLPLLAALFTLVSCDQQVQLDVASAPVSNKLPKNVKIKISAEQVCTDTTFTNAEGIEVQGKRDCKNVNAPCEKMGDTYCMMLDANLYGVLDKNLTEANVKKDIPFSGKRGQLESTLNDCDSDGATGCIVPAEALALSPATIAAKVVQEHVVAGVTGTYNPGFPARNQVMVNDTVNGKAGLIPICGGDGATSCRATPAFNAVALSELQAPRIRESVTLGGVLGTYTGSFDNCAADGADSCITTSQFVSLDKSSVNSAKVRSSVRLAGVLGSLVPRPADCSASLSLACVTTSSFPAADHDLIIPENIKTGERVANVTGLYPSTTHRLVGDTAAPDLAQANFASRMASADSFEYWDAAGNRYSSRGDANLVKGNIVTGTEIFSVIGELAGSPAPCSDSLSLSCVATASHVAYQASRLKAENIKTGVPIGAVTGGYPSAAHPLAGATATADLNSATFESQLRSGASFEYWNAAGQKFTAAGSTDLAPANIATGTTLFGVVGSLTTRPDACADGLLLNCVTSANFPAYDPALLKESVIKSGVTIGNVVGKYPSITYPLADATATVDLTQGNFASRLPSANNFEFWDSAGQRYVSRGDALFAASHLRKDLTIFGVTGSVTPTAPDCTAANKTGCVATADFPSYRKASLVPGVLKTGTTLMAVTGTYPSASTPLAANTATDDLGDQADLYSRLDKSGSFEFFDSTGARFSQTGTVALTENNIVSGQTIFTKAGAMVERPANCSAEGATGCLATTTYPAFNAATLTAGVLKSGVRLGGITGQYPSATFRLPGASAAADLTQSQFNSRVRQAGSFEYWDSAGVRHSKDVPSTILSSQILAGESIFGVGGSAADSPEACSGSLTTSCVTSATFPSYRPADFTAGIIKSGVTIAGTRGQYPSSTFRLPGASTTPDLTSGSLASRLKSSASFQYWDAAGNRYTGSGSDDILPEKLRTGATVYGVTGVLVNAVGSTLTAEQIRHGVKIGHVTGTLKLGCRETAGAGSAQDCSNVFVDRTSGGSCTSSGQNCIFEDTITKLKWHELAGNGANYTYSNAQSACGGIGSTWRIPTHKEVLTAYTHGFREYFQSKSGSMSAPSSFSVWTATISSFNASKVWVIDFMARTSVQHDTTATNRTFCVSN